MKKSNKGIALAYTLITMMLVFTICMLITTLMLAQITYYSAFSEKSEEKWEYSRLGEIFLQVKGDFYSSESDCSDAEGAKTTPFCKELLSMGYDVTKLSVTEHVFNDSEISSVWEGIEFNRMTFKLKLNKISDGENNDILSMTVCDDKKDKAMLSVRLRNTNGQIEVIKWDRERED